MKVRKFLAFIALTLFSLPLLAQSGYTVASGNLSGICYNNGSIQASWINGNPTLPVLPTLNGTPFAQTVPTNIDSSGNFFVTLADTAIVVPNSPNLSWWKITACAKGGSQPACYTAAVVPVTGATFALNSYFTAATSACTTTQVEVNNVPLKKQNPVTFNDTSSVKVTNPSLGVVLMTAQANNTPPQYVAGTSCHNSATGSSTAGTVVLTCPGMVAGNSILVTAYSDQPLNAFNSVTFGISDSQGSTFNQIQLQTGWQFNISAALYVATVGASGTDTITLTETVTNGAGPIVMFYGSADQFSGVNTAFPIVQSQRYANISGDTAFTFGLNPTQSGDLLYSSNTQQGSTTETYTSTGYTALTPQCPNIAGTKVCQGALYAVSLSGTPSLWQPTISWAPPQSASGLGFLVELAGAGNPNPTLAQYPAAGIPNATGNPTAPWNASYTARGTDAGVPTAGTLAGSTGAAVCKDASGGIDTVGCTTAGVSSASAVTPLLVNGAAGPVTGAVAYSCPGCAIFATATDVTGSRSIGTIFHNTGTTPRFVSGFLHISGGSGDSTDSCLVGPSSPPTLTPWQSTTTGTVATEADAFACMVPPSYFYEIQGTNLLTTIGAWVETQ